MYRRLSNRQQSLFALAANLDPDWAGVCAEGEVIGGQVDLGPVLRGEVDGVHAAQKISRVHINDPGTSGWAEGKEIAIVPSDDYGVGLPPRVTLRNGVFKGVGADLDGVASINVYYSRRPAPIAGPDHELEIQDPHTDLLVYDLARSLVQKASGIDSKVREQAMAYFDAQEARALEGFNAYVREFASDVWRFQDKR